MRLFYLINGWAGRSEWLDDSLRFFYAGITPLLATVLLALIFLWPQRADGSTPFSRRRLFGSLALSILLCALVVIAINAFQSSALGSTPMSPRPFMTHWANILVVEPNNNSFPCYEVMLCAATATLIWAISPAMGFFSWLLVCGLGFARIYCGSNYLADSVAGAALGGALSTLALAACRVPLRFSFRAPVSSRTSYSQWRWRLRHQGAFSGATLLVLFSLGFYWLLNTPPHGAKLHAWLDGTLGQSAVAAPTDSGTGSPANSPGAPLHENIHEGEGAASGSGTAGNGTSVPGEMLLDSRAARLDGHLPESEKYLHQVLGELHAPYPIVGINVAQVLAGTTGYRVAAIRIEIKPANSTNTKTNERARVTQVAASLIRRAFQADAQLQHVDLIGLQRDAPPVFTSNEFYPAPKWTPVFTASIERRDLVIHQAGKPKWVNDPRLEGGLWLRARSLLYIDSQVLPAAAEPPVAPKPLVVKPISPQPIAPQPNLTPTPIPSPTPQPTVIPQPAPRPQTAQPLRATGEISSFLSGTSTLPVRTLAPTHPTPTHPIAPSIQPAKRSRVRRTRSHQRRRFRRYRRHRTYRYRRHR